MDILGYLSDFHVAPGASVQAYVSSEVGDYRARIVALDHGDDEAPAPARWSGAVDLGSHAGREQPIATGSCVVIPTPAALDDRPVVMQVTAWPTIPADGRPQGIVSWIGEGGEGLWIGLTPEGRAEVRLGCDGGVARVTLPTPMAEREWHRLTVVVDPRAGRLRLSQLALSSWLSCDEQVEADLPGGPAWPRGPLVLGASRASADRFALAPDFSIAEPFNGKLARPWIAAGIDAIEPALQHAVDAHGPERLGDALVSAWDFANAHAGTVADRGPAGASGFTLNHPASGVTGPTWNGREVDFRREPRQYDALHFHDDDLDDARWQADFELTVPADCASGLYGVALEGAGVRDVIPLIVRPPAGTATAATAVWLPTYTYQAYANQRWSPAEAHASEHLSLLDEPAEQPGDKRLDAHYELGLSLYDCHRDGSAARYSSRLRPIVNLRPQHRYRHHGHPREFSGDVHFLRWLQRKGRHVDLVTDADLDREGAELFSRYRAVVSGSHPEYVTHEMHCAVEEFVTGSGRLAYLAGNGLYWVTGVDPAAPHVIEVRRGHGGSNPTGDSPPGESHMSSTGEMGGLWRHRGRAPQRAVGVGTTAIGWGRSNGYAWTEHAGEAGVAFVTNGVDVTEPLGAGTDAFPLGAANDEMDRADRSLGTPPQAVLLATSHGRHDEHYGNTLEDSSFLEGAGDPDALTRADIVYAESPGGGRLFAVGSMGWSLALWHHADVERVTENVLDEFAGGAEG